MQKKCNNWNEKKSVTEWAIIFEPFLHFMSFPLGDPCQFNEDISWR